MKIFVSYRRHDSKTFALRIADRLTLEFGKGNVFIDVEGLEGGDDFPDRLNENLSRADACVVVIGPQWLSISGPHGQRRLDSPTDYVRREIRQALDRKILVIPVLVEGAQMPVETELPPDINALARIQAVTLSSSNFADDIEHLLTPLRGRGVISMVLPAFAGPFIGGALRQLLTETTTPIAGTTGAPVQQVRTQEAVAVLGAMLFWAATSIGLGLAAKRVLRQRAGDVYQIAILVCVSAGVAELVVFGMRTFESVDWLDIFLRAFVFWTLTSTSIIIGAGLRTRLGWPLTLCIIMAVGLCASAAVFCDRTLYGVERGLMERWGTDWRIPFSVDFMLRWTLVAFVLLWASHRRFPVSGRRQVVIGFRVLIFGFVASLAGAIVTGVLGQRNTWGLNSGFAYALFAPLVLQYVIAPLRDSSARANAK